jgi:hypothetical protein
MRRLCPRESNGLGLGDSIAGCHPLAKRDTAFFVTWRLVTRHEVYPACGLLHSLPAGTAPAPLFSIPKIFGINQNILSQNTNESVLKCSVT